MEEWKKNARRDVVITDIDALVPKDHLLRKIEKVMDYDWLYEWLEPYYRHDVGRPGTDPVVLVKIGKDGTAAAYIRDSIIAANIPEDTGHSIVQVVSRIRAAG